LSNVPHSDKKASGNIASPFTSIITYKNYRFFWTGSCTEHLGEWMEITALLWLINQMTGSPFMATLLITLRYLPMVVFAFVGGIVADRINRRNLLIYALTAACISSILMAALVQAGAVQVWQLFLYSILTGIFTSFNHPARSTLLPNLVKREHFLNAITWDNASVMVSRILGGPIAGLILGLFSTTSILGINGTAAVLGLRVVGILTAILLLSRIQIPSVVIEARKESPLNNLLEGFRYIGQNKGILTQVFLYLLPIFVNNSYTGLLPYFATDILHVGPDLYGVMNAAPGVGSVIAILIVASFVTIRRKGLVLSIAGILQGLSLIIFVFSPGYILALLLLVMAGAFSTAFMTLNNTIVQEMASDKVRGRVMSLREVAMGLGPAGSLISGYIANLLSVTIALGVTGGIAVVLLLTIMMVFHRKWYMA
jgi:MFS transporter, DHA1 family, staphyloferrin A biosynthesis exporter